MSEETQDVQIEVMPGADASEPVQETLDLNFGLGEEVEDAQEPAEEVEEDVAASNFRDSATSRLPNIVILLCSPCS